MLVDTCRPLLAGTVRSPITPQVDDARTAHDASLPLLKAPQVPGMSSSKSEASSTADQQISAMMVQSVMSGSLSGPPSLP